MSDLSIIIPTYNRSNQLEKAINSVLEQTISDFELIIVDDASEDQTEETVQNYEDERIIYIQHESNQGGAAARNTGIEASTGRYVFFLDSDDEWKPTKLEKQVKSLNNLSDDYAAVYCRCDYVFDEAQQWKIRLKKCIPGLSLPQEGIEGDNEVIQELLSLRLELGGTSTLGVKRDVIKQIGGFDESFERHQDWEFLLRILEYGKIKHQDEELVIKYGYNMPSPATYEQNKRQFLSKFDYMIDRYDLNKKKVRAIHMIDVSKRYLEQGMFPHGFRLLVRHDLQIKELPGIIFACASGVLSLLKE